MPSDPQRYGGGPDDEPVGDVTDPANWVALVEYLPEGVVVADASGSLLGANRRAEQLTGIPLRSRTGEQVDRVLPLCDHQGRSWWQVQDPWGGLTTRTGSPEQDLRLQGGRSLLVASRFQRAADRSVEHVVLTMRSTRGRERAERDSVALISTVSHELRSPLTSVRGFSRTLRQRWGQLADEQKQWMLQAIETDTQRLSRLVGELLDISRIDAGRLRLRNQPIDITALVEDQVGRMISAGHDPDRFEVVGAPEPPELWGDQDRIVQILSNLLENAVRHGGGSVTVSIGQDSENVILLVADQGPGIPPEDREAVFSRFWQGSTRGGSGLGLHVVRGLVQAHGGRVEVLDVPVGATFRVLLPAGPPESLR
ncbi:PAS domain-containing sensor histidine kinase [Luteipulveratus sp. YIM 133132]|uniref:sensor histidine kinase n=1 Tax=Luteipulveratus flavus TaxID=3031728 RepID=UPI0023B03415|nr:PAS domain-containing sensor histidine kinase [Luteipulveratus sp. YIM 133132]MDE9367454.1 PAS domain-containing sensor histidine kinase [Luteipulveratus sp. YIM 133132]